MLEQFIYENHLGQRFDGLANGVYLNIGELRNYTWSYNTINSRISRFYRKTTNRKIPLYVVSQTDAQAVEAMNRLFDVTEADVALNVPGKVFVGDYYTTGFVTTSKKTNYLDSKQLCKIDLTLTSDDPAWYKDTVHSFYTDDAIPKAAVSGDVIMVSGAPASPLRGLTLYGSTTQDGTPTPDAPAALQGAGGGGMALTAAGRNLAALTPRTETNNGITSSYDAATGTITVTGTATANAFVSYWLQSYIPAGTPLVIGAGNTSADSNIILCAYSASENTFSQVAQLSSANAVNVVKLTHAMEYVAIRVETGATVDMTLRLGVMVGTSAADYVYSLPDTPQTAEISSPDALHGVPVASGGTYTDADGQQWIADTVEYDADTGRMMYVQRVAHITSAVSFGTPYKNAGEVMWRVSPAAVQLPNAGYPATLCSMYAAAGSYNDLTLRDNTIGVNRLGELLVRDDALDGADAVTARLASADFALVYPLAEPVETALSSADFAALCALKMVSPYTTLYNDAGAYMAAAYSTVANTSNASVGGYDYPYDYAHEYAVQIGGRNIANETYTGNAFRLLIYGPATNPTVTIGGHPYTVNGTVAEGETLLIDSMAKTITLTTAGGSTISYFDKRDRQNYIFQPIQPGQNAVTWPGTFGFDLTIIEERSEPKWT